MGETIATRIALIAVLVIGAGVAHADVSVVTHGIELEMPADWRQLDKGGVMVLAPKKLKGRGIEVRSLKTMPAATAESLKEALGEALGITSAKVVDRQGLKVVQADGKLTLQKIAYSVDLIVIPVGTEATVVAAFLPVDEDQLLRDAYRRILLSAVLSGPKMSVVFTATKTKGAGAPKAFVEGIGRVVVGFDAAYRFPRLLPVRFEDCGEPNAFYSSKDHAIFVCHEFFDFFTKLYERQKQDAKRIPELVSNTMLFFFLHEFGHAIVGELNLPITGKGEDAADEIATIFLINTPKPIGQAAAMAGVLAFAAMTDQGLKSTYWDTHSFNDQRMAEVVCLLYGADQKTYEPLMKSLKASQERFLKCPGNYAARLKAWNTQLAKYTRTKPKT